MSEYMLGATLALNDMIRMGVSQDWATHMIGHELTALHGLTHGATLAIVINGTLRVLREQKRGKLLQYGERIWGIADGSEEERIDRTLEATENSSVRWDFRPGFRRRGSAKRRSRRSNAASMPPASSTAKRRTWTAPWRAGYSKRACRPFAPNLSRGAV